jgi:hypothetical protein
LQERELQIWCSAPLPEGEQHRRKLRSDKYKPPAGRLLEVYESDLSVEADEDTEAEVGTDQDANGAVKSRRRTRSTVGKKSTSAVVAAISAVKAVEQKKKKRKRKAAPPPVVVTPSIPTPRSREVKSEEEEEESDKEKYEAIEELSVPEERLARRSESPAAKRQRELVQKTSEEALRRGLEAQCTAAAAQARIPAMIKPRVFWPKTRLPAVTR